MRGNSCKPNSPTTAACLLIAILFAYSAVVQLNDVDWYLWLPFYTIATLVSAFHAFLSTSTSRGIAKVEFVFGVILFLKVALEGCIRGRALIIDELFSLDMEKRVVREKLGSLLVVIAMWLQRELFSSIPTSTSFTPQAGLWLFVAASGGLCLAFFFPSIFQSIDS